MNSTSPRRASCLLALGLAVGALAVGASPPALAGPITVPGLCIIEMNVKLLCIIEMNFSDATNEFSYVLELNRGHYEAAKSEPGRFSELEIQLSNATGQGVILNVSFDLSALVRVEDPKTVGDESGVRFTQTVPWDGNDADGAPLVGLLDATETLELAYYPNGERSTLGTPTTGSFQITNTEDVEP